MLRAAAHYPSREIAVLGLVEAVLSFAVLCTVIQAALAPVPASADFDILPRGAIGLAAMLTLMTGGVALAAGLYRLDVCLNRKGLVAITGRLSITILVLLLFVGERPDSRLISGQDLLIPIIFATGLVVMALVRLAYGFAVKRLALTRRILLFGEPEHVRMFDTRLRSQRGWRFDPVTWPDQPLSWYSLKAQRIWGIVITSPPADAEVERLMDCKLRGMRVFGSTECHESLLGRIDLDALETSDLLTSRGYGASRRAAVLKRLCDMLIGSLMLIMTLPLMLLTALAIKIDSPGPVFYRQQRVGQFGKVFTLYKFRSMAQDAEAGGTPRWAQQHDPRVTRVGRFIRTTRVDELPQLANVILGQMSLVGPRPERPHFVEQLIQAIPLYCQRAYVKPGLTGWAQVNYPYGASVEDAREKLSYDLYYLKNRSIILDMIILVSTVRVVLFREGAR